MGAAQKKALYWLDDNSCIQTLLYVVLLTVLVFIPLDPLAFPRNMQIKKVYLKNTFAPLVSLICLVLCFSVSAWADDEAVQQEIVQLEQRIERLEERPSLLESIVENVSVGGVLAGAYQYQLVTGSRDAKDRGRGALPVQPEISITPTDVDQIFLKFGFGAGNGLNGVTTFILAPWAADLDDDLKDINGRNRDYLLTAWYKHTFQFDEDHTLGITGGIIDATDYIDENAFSNNEFIQFMNEALVNGPNGFAPSYDIGGAVEWEYCNFSVKAVGMGVGENEDGNSYLFGGVQCGYRLETGLCKGNYRVVYERTSDDFQNPGRTDEEYCQAYYLSCDQELGSILGAWLRLGTHDDDAAMVYQNLLSGGVNISGTLWGRGKDNIGIGYAYLTQGNLDIDKTRLFEAYLRGALNDVFAVTFDVQYEDDDYKSSIHDDVHGWITGLRMTVEF